MVDKTPTVAEQISTFRGASTENSTTTAVQDGEPLVEAAAGEDEPAVDEPARPAPKKTNAQDRIDQAVKRQRAAERERDELRGRLSAYDERLARIEAGNRAPLTNGHDPANAPDPNAPNPKSYQYGDLDARYIADVAKYEVRKELAAENEKRTQQTRAQAVTEQQKATQAFVAKGAEKFPDFKEVVFDSAQGTSPEWVMSNELGALAVESDAGHEILYYLATNPDESRRIAALPVAKQAAWFGKMEATVEKIPAPTTAANGQRSNGQAGPVRTSQAPPPLAHRVRGGGSPNPVSSDTTDFLAFERLAQQQGRR